MGMTVTREIRLVDISCGECDITFAVPDYLKRKRLQDGETWYCPNGHPRVFAETENDRLRKQLERERRSREAWESEAKLTRRQRDAAQRSAAAYKGQTTRLKKRASAGTCPCCHRTFQQLSRHMATKHPEFIEEQGPR